MATNFELQAQKREHFGTSESRRIRRKNGLVPAIVYGAGESPQPITLSHDEVIVALGHEAFYSNIVKLTIAGKAEQVILKALQRHPYKHKVLHLDFMRIRANEKLTVKVPIHFKGEEQAPGVSDQGGIVSHHCADIEVRCLPANLPEFIEVDISSMQLGAVYHLSDIQLPSGVESVALAQGEEHDAAVVSIHAARKETEEVEAGAEQDEEAQAQDAEAQQQADDEQSAGSGEEGNATNSEDQA